MRVAIVKNSIVINIAEAGPEWTPDDPEASVYPLEDASPVAPGWRLENGAWQPASSPPPAPAPVMALSKYQFRRRFTLDELVRFDNPELFVQLTPQQRAVANTLLRSFEAASEIRLDDPQLRYGMQLMVDWGLLSEERRQQILDPGWNPPGFPG